MRVLLCFQLTRNVRFNCNMHNFKFNFLSRGQLESLNLDKIFLPFLKILLCYEVFILSNLVFVIIALMLGGNHLLNTFNLNSCVQWYWKIVREAYGRNVCCAWQPAVLWEVEVSRAHRMGIWPKFNDNDMLQVSLSTALLCECIFQIVWWKLFFRNTWVKKLETCLWLT